jgi:competence protein ComEC
VGQAARLLLLLAAALWAGAACGPAVPASAAGPLALAAGLAAWCAVRRAGTSAVGWALAGFALAGGALGALAAPRLDAATDAGPARGRWVDARPLGGGTLLVLSGAGPERVFVPRTGQDWLDRFPDGARPGATLEIPLRRAEGSGLPRALSASSIVVLAPPRGLARLEALAAAARAAFLARATARLVHAADPPAEPLAPSPAPAPARDDAGALLLAMVAGERDALAPEDWGALRASGLAHQAVVSGVQVGVIVLAAAWALAPLGGPHGRGRRAVALAAACAAMVLLPAEPPVRRAGIAVLFARAGRLVGRGASPAAALAGAAALLLALDPALARSLSFALTVAATLALVIGARGTGWGPRLRLFFGPILATWPILVEMTGCAGVWSPVANLLAAPAAAPALLGGWLAVLLPAGSPVATVSEAVARLGAEWFLAIARGVAAWPGSGRIAAPAGLAWLVLHEALCFAWLAARGRRALALGLAAAVSFAWPLRPAPAAPPGASLEVLDVGQGQAVLVRDGDRALLIDAADDRARDGTRALIHALRARRVARLDALVLTQNDRDHAGGAMDLLAAAPPRRLVVGANLLDDPELRPLYAAAARRGVPLVPVAAGEGLELGRVRALVLHPRPGVLVRDNERSLVVHLLGRGLDALVTGDAGLAAERELLARGLLPRTAILVVGHHGSKGSTGDALLRSGAPGAALISAGRGNRFGHPHPETLARLAARRVPWLITARDGGLAARARNGAIEVRGEGEAEGAALRVRKRAGPA